VAADAGFPMGFQSIFAWKALPDWDFGQKVVIDAHRCISHNHLRHPTSAPSVFQANVRVRSSDSLNPIKGFDIAANVYIDPSFSPMFAADIVEKGDGYGCSYRLLITNDFKLEAVAGNEHSALVSSTKLPLGRWVSARATYNGHMPHRGRGGQVRPARSRFRGSRPLDPTALDGRRPEVAVPAGGSRRVGGSAQRASSRRPDGSDRTQAWRGDRAAPVCF
jgi:hypothetical protein